MSHSVKEMVRRGLAQPDGRPGSVAEIVTNARRRPDPARHLVPGAAVVVVCKRQVVCRGEVRGTSCFSAFVSTPGEVMLTVAPLRQVFRVDRPRRDGLR